MCVLKSMGQNYARVTFSIVAYNRASWRSWDLEVHVASSWPAQEHCAKAQEGEKWGNGWRRGDIVIWEGTNLYKFPKLNLCYLWISP
jgi:hypothetical protein